MLSSCVERAALPHLTRRRPCGYEDIHPLETDSAATVARPGPRPPGVRSLRAEAFQQRKAALITLINQL